MMESKPLLNLKPAMFVKGSDQKISAGTTT
jgi:hypothetical protein